MHCLIRPRPHRFWPVPLITLLTALLMFLVPLSGKGASTGVSPVPLAEAFTKQLIAAGIRAAEAEKTTQAMLKAGFHYSQMEPLSTLITGELGRGASLEEISAIRAKIHEGIAKQVSPARIVAAVEKVATRFQASTRMATSTGSATSAQFAPLYVDCLAAGLTKPDLEQLNRQIMSRISVESVSTGNAIMEEAIRTARDMVRQNVTSSTTSKVLGLALNNSYTVEELRELRVSLSDYGGDAETCAQALGTAIASGSRGSALQDVAQRAGLSSGQGVNARDGSGSGSGNSGSGSGNDSGNGSGNGSSNGSDGSSGGTGGNGGDNGGGGGDGGGGGRS